MWIKLNNVRIYAYHGVMPQEETVGDWYEINLRLHLSDETATVTDSLSDTVSYADVYTLIKHEMSIPSKLIEHVCGRICRSILAQFTSVDEVSISMLKSNPPIGAECQGCGIELTLSSRHAK